MSAPPSPHLSHKKRDRPPALDIPDEDRKAVSDGEIRYNREHSVKLDDSLNDQVLFCTFVSPLLQLIHSLPTAKHQHFP